MVGREKTAVKRPLTVTTTLASMVVLALMSLEDTAVHASQDMMVKTVSMISMTALLAPVKMVEPVLILSTPTDAPVLWDTLERIAKSKVISISFSYVHEEHI